MVLHLMIKNFGRVGSADISLNDLVVFVGNNNSGKTMIMQLIYGIREELKNFSVPISGARRSEQNGYGLVRCDREWFKEVETQINRYLSKERSRIIEKIFGSPIPAEEIKIGLEDTKSTYFVSTISAYRDRDARERGAGIKIDILRYEDEKNVRSYESQVMDQDRSADDVQEVLKAVWRIILSGKTALEPGQLFLPASRSGLQLLYKHYFIGQVEGDLVLPIKDFLGFLQLYTEGKRSDGSRADLLRFGEEHLLQGKVVQRGDETFYIDSQGGRAVPLYIASSMIHELTPFIKALNATQRIDQLYCDEVENSLHPLLQREMARWLIRMVNAGIQVIISSHSDTMASRLNNLLMMTYLNRKRADLKILSGLGLREADLLRPGMKASVYEFRDGGQGRTVVEELEFISHPLMGYDFQLFGINLDELYDEADKITR